MNTIHSTAIIDENVELGEGNEILPYTILKGPLKIGDGNLIGPHVVIGSPGQDTREPRYDSKNMLVEIGNDNIIREFTAIQKPAYKSVTKVGNNTFLMHGVHVPHDAIIEDEVSCAPLVVIGGISRIMNGSFLGMGCTIHQYSIVGPFSIVATGAAVTKNIRPFTRYIPGQPISLNSYAIKKYGFKEYTDEISAYVFEGQNPTSLEISQIINRYNEHHEKSGRKHY
jgi:UDP-N-acetylglucosamine acyltransferase